MRTLILTVLTLIAFAANSVLGRIALSTAPSTPQASRPCEWHPAPLHCGFLGRSGRPLSADRVVVFGLRALPVCRAVFLCLYGPCDWDRCAHPVRGGAGDDDVGRDARRRATHGRHWLGLCAAAAGLVYLVLPGLAAPPLWAAALMACAGCCWGLYFLRGRRIVESGGRDRRQLHPRAANGPRCQRAHHRSRARRPAGHVARHPVWRGDLGNWLHRCGTRHSRV